MVSLDASWCVCYRMAVTESDDGKAIGWMGVGIGFLWNRYYGEEASAKCLLYLDSMSIYFVFLHWHENSSEGRKRRKPGYRESFLASLDRSGFYHLCRVTNSWPE